MNGAFRINSFYKCSSKFTNNVQFKLNPVRCIATTQTWNVTSLNNQAPCSSNCTKGPVPPTQQLKFNRYFSAMPNQERLPHKRSLPRLMEFPEVLWPSALKTMKNWILTKCIIRPYFDSDFNIREFVFGAKQALQIISAKMAGGDISTLSNLVSQDALDKLKPIIQTLSMSQRQQLEIKKEDIYFTFPYQIGIMFNEDDEKPQKRWVEITMVFHILRGLADMQERGVEIPWNMGTLPEYQDKVFICNYRFIKEFTQGQESDWTVNVINHFKPIDLINEE